MSRKFFCSESAPATGRRNSQTAASQDRTADDPATPNSVLSISSLSIWRYTALCYLRQDEIAATSTMEGLIAAVQVLTVAFDGDQIAGWRQIPMNRPCPIQKDDDLSLRNVSTDADLSSFLA
ncbi:hypothetical protein KIN20_027546 [Parelaphostrongylus tenuis]|uniref:Uncharacterized protein n=1 Tax=Parelaphostrongylus tenuis TaxID=148309 RepID=A0AAD5WDY8_PARTN|nr:hypothetical protein KIN20_027546 [Parelaphostrongylus tenuis]